MAILYGNPDNHSEERIPLPSNAEIAGFLDLIRGESIDELDYRGPVPAVDVPRRKRPWEYLRRRDEGRLAARIIDDARRWAGTP